MGFAIYFLYQYACIVRNASSQQMQIGNAMLGTVPAFYAVAFLIVYPNGCVLVFFTFHHYVMPAIVIDAQILATDGNNI